MKSNAPGQLLGYSLQFPRALYHLLRSAPKDVVYVEVLGDVATLTSVDELVSEEDKSSIVGNPLTDRSTDLWKTLSNWIKAIISKDIDIEKTQFVLYCNHSGRQGIVNKFSSAKNEPEIMIAITDAKDELSDITIDHEIWEYYDFVLNKNEDTLVKLLKKFELQIGSASGYEEVRIEIKKKLVHESQIEFILENLSGWVQKVIIEDIATQKNTPKRGAIISWEEFNNQFLVLFERSRCRELIDFTMQYSKDDKKVTEQVNTRPKYLQQLEAIELNEEEILSEISDYLRADVNLQKWIENGIIDNDVAKDFEDRLIAFWENQRKRIKITEKMLQETEQGQLLLCECKSRQESIRDISPPPSTIPGAYHALADELTIGWHPNWKKIFNK